MNGGRWTSALPGASDKSLCGSAETAATTAMGIWLLVFSATLSIGRRFGWADWGPGVGHGKSAHDESDCEPVSHGADRSRRTSCGVANYLDFAEVQVIPPSVGFCIVQSPASVNVVTNDPANFIVGVQGAGPFTYQWKHAGTNLPGATGSALFIPSAGVAQAGAYTVQVTSPKPFTYERPGRVESGSAPQL